MRTNRRRSRQQLWQLPLPLEPPPLQLPLRELRRQRPCWWRRFARESLFFATVLLAAAAAQAASIFEFDQWMQRVEKRALSVQRNLDRADGAAGATDAREIEELYRRMEDYFVLMGDAARAVELSRKGRQDASDLAARAAANDFAGARPIIKSMMEDCRTCHREYKPLT